MTHNRRHRMGLWVCTISWDSPWMAGLVDGTSCFWFIFWSRQAQQQGAYHCLFVALMSPSKLRRSGITAFTPIILDSLSFADLAIMEGQIQEDRAVSGMVSRPSPNSCHRITPSNAQCPSLRRSCLSPSFSPPSTQDSPAEDMIYAHLDLRTFSERLNTPAPLSPMHPFPEPSIYEAFNVKKDCAEPWPGPRLWAHRVLQIEDSDLFLKGLLRGHSSSSSKAAQQLWGEQWNPRLQDHRQKSQNIWVISCLF